MEWKNETLCSMLPDAACEENPEIEHAIRQGDFAVAKSLLRRRRSELLEKLHMDQKALDSLDFLMYQMNKLQNNTRK